MRWRLWLTLALVVLAGCGSLFADGDGPDESPDGTLTAAPVPHATATPERWPVAPGLSGAGVVDVDVLVAAHLEAVAERSYTWREYRGAATVFDAGGRTDGNAAPIDRAGTATVVAGTATVVAGTATGSDTGAVGTDVGAGPSLSEAVRVFPSSVARVEAPTTYVAWTSRERIRIDGAITHVANYSEYADGDIRHVRYRLPGSPDPLYDRDSLVDAGYNDIVGEQATEAIRRYLPSDQATVVETTVDGRTRYEVVVHWRDLPGVNALREYRARAVVSPDGFVRSLNVSYVDVSAGAPRHVRYRFVYEAVNETTVDPPAWAGDR